MNGDTGWHGEEIILKNALFENVNISKKIHIIIGLNIVSKLNMRFYIKYVDCVFLIHKVLYILFIKYKIYNINISLSDK